jgi:hypothetical protein
MRAKILCLLGYLSMTITTFAQSPGDYFNQSFLSEKHLAKGEFRDKMKVLDFNSIWTTTDNKQVYGFIGNNYQRLRIKLISVKKDPANATQYIVYGKSAVKGNICDFKGKLIITSIRKHRKIVYGVDDEFKNKELTGQYSIKGNYVFSENKTQLHVGLFKGVFQSEFYTTKDGRVHYDDINIASDSYINNQFTGLWLSYDGKNNKPCNWGDYRIPNSGKLDNGAGEFSPADHYLRFGWQTVRDAYNTGPNSAKAKKEEGRAWWK